MQKTEPPYEEFDTTLVIELKPEDIVKLRFLEEWKISKQPFAIYKTVKAIAPIRENYAPDGTVRGYTPIFWIYFDETMLPKTK